MLGLEDGSILVDGYCCIVDMAWEKPAKVKMLAGRRWKGEYGTTLTREAQT